MSPATSTTGRRDFLTSSTRTQATLQAGVNTKTYWTLMTLLFNDLSLHGQFHSKEAFRDAIGRLMAMRAIARQFGRDLQCTRNVVYARVTSKLAMLQATQALDRNNRRAVMQWLNRQGPFWAFDIIVAMTGSNSMARLPPIPLGEAAYCMFHDIDCSLVSMNPSSWMTSPLKVDYALMTIQRLA